MDEFGRFGIKPVLNHLEQGHRVRQGMSERGSAAVEFALVIPAIVLVVLAVTEVVVVARTQLELAQAAREGARVAAIAADPAQAVSATRVALGELASDASVTVDRPFVVGESATVVIRFPVRVFGLPITLQADAAMRVES
jgi:hypothetical protein